MLERIRIQNFQKHERLQIDFHPAVTTIVGSTDSGKSSVIRALKWVALNQPSGDSFVRDGTKGATVRLTVDGKTVTRRRGGSRNEYRLDADEYKAFGSDVPKPVADTLRMSDVNFAMQLDPPFWLAETPGEVSRQLNAVVDLKVIDDALSAIASASRKSQTVLDVCRERLEAAEETERDLAWVPKAADAFDRVRGLEDVVIATTERRLRLRDLVDESVGFARNQKKAAQAASAGFNALEIGQELTEMSQAKDDLASTMDICRRLAADATKVPDVASLGDLYKRWDQVNCQYRGLVQMTDDLQDAERRADNARQRLKSATSALAVGTKGLCPICGSELEQNGVGCGKGTTMSEVPEVV